jgi:hypothetical protein
MKIPFNDICEKAWQTREFKAQSQGNIQWIPEYTLCLDPGHTTGYAVFNNRVLIDSGQIATKPDDYASWNSFLIEYKKVSHIIIEDYKIYSNKTDIHANADLWVPNLIGAAGLFAVQNSIPVTKQMASLVKPFCTDDKLKIWYMFDRGKRHANDAIRHGVYWLIFNSMRKK